MIALLLLILIRVYWPVDIATLASVGTAHTHVSVVGYVSYTRIESDGDLHIKLVPTPGVQTPFVIAECIPSLFCNRPAAGAHIKVSGVSRKDAEHLWQEIHPVEKLEILQ